MLANFTCAIQRKTHRLLAILDRMGVDAARIPEVRGGNPFLAAARTCITCNAGERCDAWLMEPAPAEPQAAPEFCPNATFLSHQAVWP